ncbi:MAG: signal recognition particle-docking protein FtsY [Bdellovibrionota bacterium]
MEQIEILYALGGFLFVLVTVLAIALRKKPKQRLPEAPPVKVARPQEQEAPAPVPAEDLLQPLPEKAPVIPLRTEKQRVSEGLGRTKAFFQQTMDKLFSGSQGEQFFGDMEEVLLTADVGIDFAERVVADLRKSFGLKLPARTELKNKLSDILISQLPVMNGPGNISRVTELPPTTEARSLETPRVVMVVGVNGAGKTTTVAKLCQRYQSQGKKVLVGAADTFRAAAVEQLRAWVERVGAEGVFQKEGADPSAVAFDTVQAAKSRNIDLCLIDTAGRLHTKLNLMEELKKMKRVLSKAMSSAPHEIWLVVDGSTGQNALNQAREFHQHLGLTGIIVTKLDGSAKGGIVIAIGAELKVPVVFIGVGESPEDLVPFDGKEFVETILEGLA